MDCVGGVWYNRSAMDSASLGRIMDRLSSDGSHWSCHRAAWDAHAVARGTENELGVAVMDCADHRAHCNATDWMCAKMCVSISTRLSLVHLEGAANTVNPKQKVLVSMSSVAMGLVEVVGKGVVAAADAQEYSWYAVKNNLRLWSVTESVPKVVCEW